MKLLNEHHELIRFFVFWIVMPAMGMLWGWFLLHFYPGLRTFAWDLFCDASGKPGWGRIGSWFALNAVILWITHIVWKTEQIPNLLGPLCFVGGLYGIEKLPELLAAWKGVQLPAPTAEEVRQNGQKS